MWYDCPYCDEFFTNTQELAKHREEKHPGLVIYWCSACEKTFTDYWEALEHTLWDHEVYCEDCQHDYIYELIYVPQESRERLNEISREIGKLKKERKSILKSLKTKPQEPKLEPQQTLTSIKQTRRTET